MRSRSGMCSLAQTDGGGADRPPPPARAGTWWVRPPAHERPLRPPSAAQRACRYATRTVGPAGGSPGFLAPDVLPVLDPSLRIPPPRLVAAATDASPPLPILAV